MFATIYSSEMRVSEVIHLHYGDISRTNMQIHIRDAKNRMDRYTILSKRNLALLTEYWFACGKPRDILFPNKFTGEYLTVSSVEQRNIQALLGHRDPKSAEVYLHVSNKSLMGIRSPFDRKDGTANG